MSYPEEASIKEISQNVRLTFGFNYMIYNLSETKYSTDHFNKQVCEYVFPGFPCPPLETIFIILKDLDTFLGENEKHVAIIHCQKSMVLYSIRGGA